MTRDWETKVAHFWCALSGATLVQAWWFFRDGHYGAAGVTAIVHVAAFVYSLSRLDSILHRTYMRGRLHEADNLPLPWKHANGPEKAE